MFINELPLHINTPINLFTDDTTLLASSDNVRDLETILSCEVAYVDEWATYNKLPLNCFKTKTILVDGQRLGKRLSNENENLRYNSIVVN